MVSIFTIYLLHFLRPVLELKYSKALRYAVFGSRKKPCSSKPHFVRFIPTACTVNDVLGLQWSFLVQERIIKNHFRRIIINIECHWRCRLYVLKRFFFQKTVDLQGFCSKSAYPKCSTLSNLKTFFPLEFGRVVFVFYCCNLIHNGA